jgi:hypothetical protein
MTITIICSRGVEGSPYLWQWRAGLLRVADMLEPPLPLRTRAVGAARAGGREWVGSLTLDGPRVHLTICADDEACAGGGHGTGARDAVLPHDVPGADGPVRSVGTVDVESAAAHDGVLLDQRVARGNFRTAAEVDTAEVIDDQVEARAATGRRARRQSRHRRRCVDDVVEDTRAGGNRREHARAVLRR